MSKRQPPEIEAAIDALKQGSPIGNVIRDLEAFIRRKVVESYRSGLSLSQCAALYGLMNRQAAHKVIRRDAPDLMRPVGGGYRKGTAFPQSGNRYAERRQIRGAP